MHIVKCTQAHLDKFVDVFEEYRQFCGFGRSPNETNAIRIELKTDLKNTTARNLYKSMGFIEDSDYVYYRVPC
ncbi:hypothetical protein CXF93_12140 [Moritella sp. Urea-trap-13]|nr:hypothetical protein CXF93_12140 [Moritella sp. Urea-trap-13]